MSGIAMISSSSSIQWAVTQIINKSSTYISSEKVVTKLPQELNLVPFTISLCSLSVHAHFHSVSMSTFTFSLCLCPKSSVQSTTIVRSSTVGLSPVQLFNQKSTVQCKSHEINKLENWHQNHSYLNFSQHYEFLIVQLNGVKWYTYHIITIMSGSSPFDVRQLEFSSFDWKWKWT